MLVIVGLIVLLVVGLVAIVGVLTNAGAGHPPIENFVVFGYHPAGSTGTLFLLGIMVGVVASLGFAALIIGARPRHPVRAPTSPQTARPVEGTPTQPT